MIESQPLTVVSPFRVIQKDPHQAEARRYLRYALI